MVTRRELLKNTSLAAAAAAVFGATDAVAEKAPMPLPSVNDLPNAPKGAPTDFGDFPSFKYSFSQSKYKAYPGAGKAREATVEEFPISKGLAGVDMTLEPGGMRELHWHATAAEWAYMLTGHARITVIDPDGSTEVVDFGPGDVWYFPRGFGHSIQAKEDGCHFILVFDNGYFSEFGTFSITDWIYHTPPEVLTKNLGISAEDFSKFPKEEAYIIKGPLPGPLDQALPPGTKRTPLTHRFQLEKAKPLFSGPGGTVQLVSQKEFPVSTTMAGALEVIHPGSLRELHWHPNADEWQFYIGGKARMTVFGSHGRSRTFEFNEGDVGYVPQGYGHYVENIGDKNVKMLAVFNNGDYQDISLSDWLAKNPKSTLVTNFGVPESVFANIPKEKLVITKGFKG